MAGIEKHPKRAHWEIRGSFPSKEEILAKADEIFPAIGITEGKKVVDFGCGEGTFAIPIAKRLGENGTLFALDVSAEALKKLEISANREGLNNIKTMQIRSEEDIPLPEGSVDIFLLFDVLHLLDEGKLFPQIRRVLKQDGLVCIYPHHHFEEKELLELGEVYRLRLVKVVENAIFVFEFGEQP